VLEPHQLQQLTEALQQGNEFRKWLVNSYNACAVTQKQYAEQGASFQGMDNAARSIQEVLDKGIKTPARRASLAVLVNTYLQLARGLQCRRPEEQPMMKAFPFLWRVLRRYSVLLADATPLWAQKTITCRNRRGPHKD